MAYDIFLSYRRKGAGAGVAGELQTKLENRGFKVFLDVDNIGSGDFPEQIDHAIRDCNDFLLILSPNMLDRCSDEEDWVRHEIVLAEKYQKNVIGVSLPGFVMPEAPELPEPLRHIPEKQVFLWSHEYRNASIDKIVNNLVSSKRKKSKKQKTGIVGIVAAVLLIGGIVAWQLTKPEPEPSEEVMTISAAQPTTPVVDVSTRVRDTFNIYAKRCDSLLRLVPDSPKSKDDFEKLMTAFQEYNNATAYKKDYPRFITDDKGVGYVADSLNRVRKSLFDTEIKAAKGFADVDMKDQARSRFQNAKILATADDQKTLETVGRKIPE